MFRLEQKLIVYYNSKTAAETQILHFHSVNYISPYFVGLLLGYVFTNKLETTDKRFFACGWIICFALIYVIGQIPLLIQSKTLSREMDVALGASLRTIGRNSPR